MKTINKDDLIEVHKNCNGLIKNIGEDCISYCEDCETIVEGDTHFITEEEFENAL